ncbi:MAG TPA: hypothetical protein PKA27_10485 [Fimbriimonadaceae bacterium]|nr:hypothetical protein [Fimbriimonadaceae bacterium]
MSAAPALDPKGDRILIDKPWAMFPLLYLMQAMPVHIVQDVSTLVYKDLGIPNAEIAKWTSLIALPWSMQFLLGPLVDFNSTKRRWILGGQLFIAIGLILAALSIGTKDAFAVSLAILMVTAISSALCNIATDGFYIISLTKYQREGLAPVQTTCYRLGRLAVVFGMVKGAGWMISQQQVAPERAWTTVLTIAAVVYLLGHVVLRLVLKPVESDEPRPETEPNQTGQNLKRTLALVFTGLTTYFALNGLVRLVAHGLWSLLGADPVGKWKGWMLSAPVDPEILRWGPIPAGNNPLLAELIQFVVCGTIAVASQAFFRRSVKGSEMETGLRTFFFQDGIVPLLIFVLFYRFPEAMIGKMTGLFYRDDLTKGGLGLTTEIVGDIKGLFGVIGIIVGGIIGGYIVHRVGLKRAFWMVALAMHVPNLLYLAASYQQSMFADNMMLLRAVELVDQAGYGIGYAAYFVYLMSFAAKGHYQTTHYAIAAGLGALCISLAGILGGILQSNFGWSGTFWGVMILGIPALWTLLIIPVEQDKSVQVQVE